MARADRIAAGALAALALLLTPALSRAGDDEDEGSGFLGLYVGVKGGAGGNLMLDSTEVPSYLSLTPFDGDGTGAGGGWSAGAGACAELYVLWGYLSLELDLYAEKSTLWTDIDHLDGRGNKVAESRWLLEWVNIRIPLLLKGNLSVGIVRLSLGLGPEFVIGMDPGTEFEMLDGAIGEANEALIRSAFKARTKTDTYLSAMLGIAVQVWRLSISFDIRFAYFPDQETDYLERMQIETEGNQLTGFNMLAQATMDLHLLLGVSYEFDLL